MSRFKWISVDDRLPNKNEQIDNWKFQVCNVDDGWVDAAYYDEKDPEWKWNNGETEVMPTHWQPLTPLPL